MPLRLNCRQVGVISCSVIPTRRRLNVSKFLLLLHSYIQTEEEKTTKNDVSVGLLKCSSILGIFAVSVKTDYSVYSTAVEQLMSCGAPCDWTFFFLSHANRSDACATVQHLCSWVSHSSIQTRSSFHSTETSLRQLQTIHFASNKVIWICTTVLIWLPSTFHSLLSLLPPLVAPNLGAATHHRLHSLQSTHQLRLWACLWMRLPIFSQSAIAF